MSTITDRVTKVLSEETGVPAGSIIITRDGKWREARAGDLRIVVKRGEAIVQANVADGSGNYSSCFPRSTSINALRNAVGHARRMATSARRSTKEKRVTS